MAIMMRPTLYWIIIQSFLTAKQKNGLTILNYSFSEAETPLSGEYFILQINEISTMLGKDN